MLKDDNPRGVNAEHVRKLKQILALLDAASSVDGLDVQSFRLHELKGDLKGFGSITVRSPISPPPASTITGARGLKTARRSRSLY
jgi:hypothetical protein